MSQLTWHQFRFKDYLDYSQALSKNLGLTCISSDQPSIEDYLMKICELTHRKIKLKNGLFEDVFFDMREVDFSPRKIFFCKGTDEPEYLAWKRANE